MGLSSAVSSLTGRRTRHGAEEFRHGPLTPSDLARESTLAPASVNALVDRLTRKGVARRVPHPADARRVLVEIDPVHLARSEALFTRFLTAMRDLCADYDADQLRLVAGFVSAAARVQLDAAGDLPTAGSPANLTEPHHGRRGGP